MVLRRGQERILLVDDELTLVEMGKRMLEDLGYRVEARTDSVEAMEVFRAQPDQFELVITDYTMPHMTGLDLTREVLAVRPDIPVILCTGFSESFTEEKVNAKGIRKLVMKPFTKQEIAWAVAEALEDARGTKLKPGEAGIGDSRPGHEAPRPGIPSVAFIDPLQGE